MLSRSIFPTARTIFPTSILCPGVVTRFMGGGKRYSKHNPKIHIKQRHRLILKYCEDIFKNRSRWVRMESLMYSDTFRGWTKVKTFLGAFESEKGRGEYEIQRKTEQKKGTGKACKPTSSKGSKDWWSGAPTVSNAPSSEKEWSNWKSTGKSGKSMSRSAKSSKVSSKWDSWSDLAYSIKFSFCIQASLMGQLGK